MKRRGDPDARDAHSTDDATRGFPFSFSARGGSPNIDEEILLAALPPLPPTWALHFEPGVEGGRTLAAAVCIHTGALVALQMCDGAYCSSALGVSSLRSSAVAAGQRLFNA